MGGPRWDEDFIYAYRRFEEDVGEKPLMMYLLSRDCEPLDRVDLDKNVIFFCATSDRVLFYNMLTEQMYYVDKSEIGSDGLTLKPMQMPTRPVAGD